MKEQYSLYKSRLHFPIGKSNGALFFSLVDYRNNYFTSDDPDKIIEFYNGFKTRDHLIQWMKERPKGVSNIYEVEGDCEVVVVIPTADFNGKYAIECRENIFKGFHIIFVESGGKRDFYFNFAHNMNIGLKKALEYNPKWIVCSNDDMRKIDESHKLTSELSALDPRKTDIVFTSPSPTMYHSKPSFMGKTNLLGRLYYIWIQKTGIAPYDFWSYLYRGGGLLNISDEVILLPTHFKSKLFFHNPKPLVTMMSFSIFSGKFVESENGEVFKEFFVNGAEDWDVSYRAFYKGLSYDFIQYQISEYSGATLGAGGNRAIRDVANVLMFNHLYAKDFS